MLYSYITVVALAMMLFISSATASVIPRSDSLLLRDDKVVPQPEAIPSPEVSTTKKCPDACPMVYDPVCAVNASGVWKTFGNACELSVHNCKNPYDLYTEKCKGKCKV